MADQNTAFPFIFDAAFIGEQYWLIDGEQVRRQTDEVTTYDTLTLQFRVSQATLQQQVRPLKSDEGKVEVLATDDGGYVAIDRANGNNSYSITPPDPREPLRQKGTYHVRRYEENVVEQTADEWDVELELIPEKDREDTPSINEGGDGAAYDWVFPQAFGVVGQDIFGFKTQYGSITTARVDAELAGTGETGVERYELTARLTFDQAHVFEAALSKVDATRIKEIPDAPNVVRDETTNDDMTITVSSPDQDTISDGDYVVLEWESERLNDAYQQVSMVLAG